MKSFSFHLWAICLALVGTSLTSSNAIGDPVVAAKWNLHLSATIDLSSPAIASDGTIYIATSDAKLFAITPGATAGTFKWPAPFHFGSIGEYTASPAIDAAGTIYISSRDHLFAVNPNDGTQKWSSPAGGGLNCSPAIAPDGTIYVAADEDRMLFAVSPVDGAIKWSFPASHEIDTSLAISDSAIYFATEDGHLNSVSFCGSLNWSVSIGFGPNPNESEFTSSPAIGSDGTIYIGSLDGNLYAFNFDGLPKWETPFPTGAGIVSSPTIGPDGVIYIGSDDGNLYAVNPDGSQKWVFPAGGAIHSSAAISADGTVYVGCNNGNFYAIDPNGPTGPTAKWIFNGTFDEFRSSPAIGANGTVYVGSHDGNLYALNNSSPLASSVWPMFLKGLTHVPSTPPISRLLTSKWHADGDFLDSTGNANGTPAGNVTFGLGQIDEAFVFDGDHDGVKVGDHASLHLQNFTIAGWIQRSDTARATHQSGQTIGMLLGYGGWQAYGFGMFDDGYLFLTQAGIGNVTLRAASITDDTLHHVAVTKNGAAVTFYIDGVAYPVRDYNPTFSFNAGGAVVGALGDGLNNTFWGRIDEMSIYGQPLTTPQLQAVYINENGVCPEPQPPCASISSDTDLVAWWRGEGSVGDAVGGFHDGVSATLGFEMGKVGQAFSLDGSLDGVQVENRTDLQLQDFTIEGWIRRADSSIATHGSHGNALIFGYNWGGYGFGIYNDGRLLLTKVGYDSVTSDATITDTQFHHVAVTKSGNSVIFYVDGVAHFAPSYGTTFEFNSGAAIGARGDDFEDSFLGEIDELSIYRRALNFGEVNGIVDASYTGKCPMPCVDISGLVSWWQVEQNAFDAVGDNHGTLAGEVGFYTGKIGNGFVFDGDYDAVQVGNPANLQLQEFTIEAWVQRNDPDFVSYYGNTCGSIFCYGQGGYGLGITDDGSLFLSKIGVSATWAYPEITDTAIHHIAVSKTGSEVVFYVDGTPYPAGEYDPGFTFTTPAAIGARGDNLSSSFTGTIDEVGIYNRGLSESEIRTIYRSGNLGRCLIAPTIVTPLANQTVDEGASVTFKVTIRATSPLIITWKHGANVIVGEHTGELTLKNVQPGDAGSYSVTIENSLGSVSSSATLTVTPASCIPGLISWWKGNGNALDSAGSNPGNLAGDTAYSGAVVNDGFHFDGNGDGVRVGNSTSLRLQDFTIEAWVRRESSTIVSHDNACCGLIFSWGGHGYGFGMYNNGGLFLSKIGDDNVSVYPGITDTGFHHLAVTKSGTKVVFYVDGVPFPAPDYNTHFDFYQAAAIGAKGDDIANSFLGVIDEVSIYDRALRGCQIDAIQQTSTIGKCAGLVPASLGVVPQILAGWWRAEGNTTDASPGGHTGTLVGEAGYGTGEVGQAFTFSGDGSGISLGNPAGLQLQTFTIEAWIKRSSASIVSKVAGDANLVAYGQGGYGLGLFEDGRLYLSKIGVDNVAMSLPIIADTCWHHVAVTKNGSTVIFYVDGEAYPVTSAYNSVFSFTTNVGIGMRGDYACNNFYGAIDEPTIYNIAIDGTTMRALYQTFYRGKFTQF